MISFLFILLYSLNWYLSYLLCYIDVGWNQKDECERGEREEEREIDEHTTKKLGVNDGY